MTDPEESAAAAAQSAAAEAAEAADAAAEAAETAEVELHSDSQDPAFGSLGRPLRRDSPFMLGFLGALGVFVAWFLVQAVVQARDVLVLIAVALFLAIGLSPTVEWLIARGIRRGLAIGIVFLGDRKSVV